MSTIEAIGPVSNDAAFAIETQIPYTAEVTIRGICPVLFHRYSVESVEAKGKAAKNSEAKKTDDIESYVYRNADDHICLPGLYVTGSMTDRRNGAAKYRQDPRSPRKSALDLYKAGVIPISALAPVTNSGGQLATTWDYLDKRRVVVGQSAIARVRPAFTEGWTATVDLLVTTPEYISPTDLLDCLSLGGKLVGVADFRPTFGRFQVVKFAVRQ